jgi:hypothetical protein
MATPAFPRLFPFATEPGTTGALTPIGTTRFQAARQRLAQIAGREVEHVADADVVAFLALGETQARRLLEQAPGG